MTNLLLEDLLPAVEPARERNLDAPPCTQQHRWTEEGQDGISTCNACGEESGQLRAPSYDNHFTTGPLKPGHKNCKHLWHGPDEDRLLVCGLCGGETRYER